MSPSLRLVAVGMLPLLAACGPAASHVTATSATSSVVQPERDAAADPPREPEPADREPPADPEPATDPEPADHRPSGGQQAGEPAPTGTATVDVERRSGEPAVVTAVRFASHSAYDRVVIDLKGADMPGYLVTWADELIEDGSGHRIDTDGRAFLHVTLTPADAHTERGIPTWRGGPIYEARLGNLLSVVRTGDFEGRVGVGLVLDRRAGFRVTELGSPKRLVIDVAD
jgi:hypothetical protein